jgi:hypothetical protein
VYLFIGMNGLCMLSQIIQSRELLPAMAGKWTLAGVFPNERWGDQGRLVRNDDLSEGLPHMSCEMLTPGEDHAALAISATGKSL